MSLILDALNRARQERGDEGPPALPTATVETPRGRPLVPLLAVALALAVVVIGWLAWERWRSPAVAGGTDAKPAGTASPPQPVEAASSPVATSSPRPVEAASSVGAAPSPRQGRAAGDGPRREGAPPATVPAVRPVKPDPAVAALYAAPPADAAAPVPVPEDVVESAPEPEAAADAPAEETIDIEAVLARAREAMGEPALAPHPAPLLADLSQQQKDAIPTLMYLRHDYVQNGASSVLINGETRRVGDRIGTVQVEEILRDSVVLRHRDTLFRLRALNSWVNL